MLLIALCIIGFFVYKRYFAPSGNLLDNFDNFNNDNNLGYNFSNNNNSGDNFVVDNFDKADLEILNMPAPSVSPSK